MYADKVEEVVKSEPVYEINAEFQKAFDLIENGDNLFITGSGGVGKSVFLEILAKRLRKEGKRAMVVAPTGISAVRVSGVTIHRGFGLPIHPLDVGYEIPEGSYKWKNYASVLANIDVLLVDEISMVRADIFSAMDTILQGMKQSALPFGGVQVVVFGDLFQLPPIVKSKPEKQFMKDHYGTIYFFNSFSYREGSFKMIEFNKMYRQKNQEFRDALNRVRLGDINQELLDYINKKVYENQFRYADSVGDDYVYLVTNNKRKEEINLMYEDAIEEKEYEFEASISGDMKESDTLFASNLKFKVGARIMTIYNEKSPIPEYVNGDLGEVHKIRENEDGTISIILKMDKGIHIDIERVTIEKLTYTYNEKEKKLGQNITGSLTQYPFVLAWARTIHKSQSATLDKIFIDFGNYIFAKGLIYTALSRITDYEHLGLKRPLQLHEFDVEKEIVEFYQKEKEK